jgi:hypothetical protein
VVRPATTSALWPSLGKISGLATWLHDSPNTSSTSPTGEIIGPITGPGTSTRVNVSSGCTGSDESNVPPPANSWRMVIAPGT